MEMIQRYNVEKDPEKMIKIELLDIDETVQSIFNNDDNDYDDIKTSMRSTGVILRPITVYADSKRTGRFKIVDGVERFEAAKALDLEEVPVSFLCAANDEDLGPDDLTPIEIALIVGRDRKKSFSTAVACYKYLNENNLLRKKGRPSKSNKRVFNAKQIAAIAGIEEDSLRRAIDVVDYKSNFLIRSMDKGTIGIRTAYELTKQLSKISEDKQKEVLDNAEKRAEENEKTETLDVKIIKSDIDRKHKKTPPPETTEKKVSKPGDVWHLGDHKLLVGDSTLSEDVKLLMGDKRADIIITDPPYGVDYTKKPKNKDKKHVIPENDEELEEFNDSWKHVKILIPNAIMVAKEHAVNENTMFYMFHSDMRRYEIEQILRDLKVHIHQTLIWVKNKAVYSNNMHYRIKHEPCFMGWIGKKIRRSGIKKEESVLEFDGLSGEDRHDHPTPKPPTLLKTFIEQHIPVGGLCYEPFSGSGSQIIAGEMCSRSVYAIEKNPKFVDVAVRWWMKETGKEAILESSGKTFDEVANERIDNYDKVPA